MDAEKSAAAMDMPPPPKKEIQGTTHSLGELPRKPLRAQRSLLRSPFRNRSLGQQLTIPLRWLTSVSKDRGPQEDFHPSTASARS